MRITTEDLPVGYLGERYSVQLETDYAEPSALSWRIGNDSWPPRGLKFGEDGILSGTPEETWRSSLEFVAHNRDTGEWGSRVLMLAVTARKPEDLKIADDSVPDATAGAPYCFTLECSGGIPPYEWGVDGLPDGLRFENGTISGTAKYSGGSAPFTVCVRDAEGSAATRFYFINVK